MLHLLNFLLQLLDLIFLLVVIRNRPKPVFTGQLLEGHLVIQEKLIHFLAQQLHLLLERFYRCQTLVCPFRGLHFCSMSFPVMKLQWWEDILITVLFYNVMPFWFQQFIFDRLLYVTSIFFILLDFMLRILLTFRKTRQGFFLLYLLPRILLIEQVFLCCITNASIQMIVSLKLLALMFNFVPNAKSQLINFLTFLLRVSIPLALPPHCWTWLHWRTFAQLSAKFIYIMSFTQCLPGCNCTTFLFRLCWRAFRLLSIHYCNG